LWSRTPRTRPRRSEAIGLDVDEADTEAV